MKLLFGLLLFWVILGEGVSGAQMASDYIREKGGGSEDPLVGAFKEILIASKEGDWKKVERILSDMTPVLRKYASEFNIDLMPRLKRGADARDSGEVARIFAQVLFLGMNENFSLAMKERLENYDRSFHYLATARSYYGVLAGNVMRRDPPVHDEIMRQFEQAQFAIGNPGLLGAGKTDPDPQRFASAAKAIEMNIKRVYTYFTK